MYKIRSDAVLIVAADIFLIVAVGIFCSLLVYEAVACASVLYGSVGRAMANRGSPIRVEVVKLLVRRTVEGTVCSGDEMPCGRDGVEAHGVHATARAIACICSNTKP